MNGPRAFKITRQDGSVEEHPLPASLIITMRPGVGGDPAGFQGGTYSSSEVRSIELPEFQVVAPPPEPLPPLKEIEEDVSIYASSDVPGVRQRIGPRRTYRRQVPDWPEPAPLKPKRKPRSPKEAA